MKRRWHLRLLPLVVGASVYIGSFMPVYAATTEAGTVSEENAVTNESEESPEEGVVTEPSSQEATVIGQTDQEPVSDEETSDAVGQDAQDKIGADKVTGDSLTEGDADKVEAANIKDASVESPVLGTVGDTTWQNDYDYVIDYPGADYAYCILLREYRGSESDVRVPATAVIGGRSYHVCFNGGMYDFKLSSSVRNFSVESGVEANTNVCFAGNPYVTSIDLRGLFTSSTSSFCGWGGGMVDGEFQSWDVGMFEGCTNLKSVNMSGLNTSNVTNMNSMFKGCTSLESVDLSGWNTSKVKKYSNMFYNCRSLTKLDLSSFTINSEVSEYDGFISGCSKLDYIKTPGSSAFDRLPINGRGTYHDENNRSYATLPIADHSIILKSAMATWADCPWENSGNDSPALSVQNVTYNERTGQMTCTLAGPDDSCFYIYVFRNNEFCYGQRNQGKYLPVQTVSNYVLAYHASDDGNYRYYYVGYANEQLANAANTYAGSGNSYDESKLLSWWDARPGQVSYGTGTYSYGARPSLPTPTGLSMVDANGTLTFTWNAVEHSRTYDPIIMGYYNSNPKSQVGIPTTGNYSQCICNVDEEFYQDPNHNFPPYDTPPRSYDILSCKVMAISSDLTQYANSNWRYLLYKPASGTYEVMEDKNGLYQQPDGQWFLYKNGSVLTGYNDLYCDSKVGWWYVRNGKVAFDYNDLFNSPTYGWWKINGGAVDFGYNDLYESPTCGWWKISGGAVDFGYNDLYESPTRGWWKIAGGRVDFGYTDLYESPTCGWWKIAAGTVDFGYNDLYESPTCGWWKVQNGYVDFGYNDLFGSPTVGWWKIAGGTVDFGYNDLLWSPACGWWKINGGYVDFGYNDLFGSPTVGWWKIAGGTVDFAYSDLYCSPACGWWKVQDGYVDFAYNDLYWSPTCGWWLVSGGSVAFGYSDLFGSPTVGWWKINSGAVDFGYNDLYFSPSCGWWKIKDGYVDFGYSDIFDSPTCGWWKINGGTVDFGYNGEYDSPQYGTKTISGGHVVS